MNCELFSAIKYHTWLLEKHFPYCFQTCRKLNIERQLMSGRWKTPRTKHIAWHFLLTRQGNASHAHNYSLLILPTSESVQVLLKRNGTEVMELLISYLPWSYLPLWRRIVIVLWSKWFLRIETAVGTDRFCTIKIGNDYLATRPETIHPLLSEQSNYRWLFFAFCQLSSHAGRVRVLPLQEMQWKPTRCKWEMVHIVYIHHKSQFYKHHISVELKCPLIF
jgi:hypothetical protein